MGISRIYCGERASIDIRINYLDWVVDLLAGRIYSARDWLLGHGQLAHVISRPLASNTRLRKPFDQIFTPKFFFFG